MRYLYKAACWALAYVLFIFLLYPITASTAQVYNPPPVQVTQADVAASATQTKADIAASIPLIVKSVNVLTDAAGNFSVTWDVPFNNPQPAATAETVMSGTQLTTCQITRSDATGVAGFCSMAAGTTLGANLLAIAGVTINPYPSKVAGGTRVVVIARTPTQ